MSARQGVGCTISPRLEVGGALEPTASREAKPGERLVRSMLGCRDPQGRGGAHQPCTVVSPSQLGGWCIRNVFSCGSGDQNSTEVSKSRFQLGHAPSKSCRGDSCLFQHIFTLHMSSRGLLSVSTSCPISMSYKDALLGFRVRLI